MDRSARTAGVTHRLSDLEVLRRASVEADLPGILGAYGWQAVRGEDAWERRVLTDAEETRHVVVTRRPEDGHWQWWDTAVGIIGNIVDAVRRLLGFQMLHEIIGLLRRALDDPPEPLPVLDTEDQGAMPERTSHPVATAQLHSDEHTDEQIAQTVEPDETTAPVLDDARVEIEDSQEYYAEDDQAREVLTEELVEVENEAPNEAMESAEDTPAEAQNNGAVETSKILPASSRGTKRRRR